jgi:thiosulfate/3-mercaptopyruvate sulfurtransferase
MLISAPELARALSNPNLRLMDCRFALDNPAYGHTAYCHGHIAGAHYADLNRDLSSPVIPGKTGRHPLPEMATFAKRVHDWGIDQHTPVVIYDDGPGAFAARLWWLLRWIGVENVQLLDGGLKAWRNAGGDTVPSITAESTGHAVTTPTLNQSAFASQPSATWLVGAHEVLNDLAKPQMQLIDARALPRFQGKVEPLDPVAGHIPGAVCYPFEDNLTAEGCFKTPSELQQRFAAITDRNIVCYCGSGVTACHNLFALHLAGFQHTRLYAGSWSEWITDPSRPITTAAQTDHSIEG